MHIGSLKIREQEAADLFLSITESTTNAILMIDGYGKITYWNRQAEKMFGYQNDEVMNKDMHTLLAPARYKTKYLRGMEHFRKTGQGPLLGKTTEIFALRSDGNEFPIELSLNSIRLQESWHAIAVVHDISKRRQAEEALRASEKQYRQIFDSIPILITYIDTKMYYRFANVAFLKTFGLTSSRVIGCHIKDVLGKSAYRKGYRNIKSALAGEQVSFEYEHYRKRKGILIFGIKYIPHRAPDGRVLGVFMLSGDITERKQAEREKKRNAELILQSLRNTIRAFALTVEKRDPYTAGHQHRVAQLATAIAREIGLSEERITGIELGALIHDIGKIYIPAEILNRPGKLTNTEFDMIKTHPVEGYDIVKEIDFPWPVAEMIAQHHERLDGSGYPKGLKGNKIVLEAQIIAVADVVEAISSHRPYRPALGIETGLEEIQKHKNNWFNPDVVDACVKLMKEKGFIFVDWGLN